MIPPHPVDPNPKTVNTKSVDSNIAKKVNSKSVKSSKSSKPSTYYGTNWITLVQKKKRLHVHFLLLIVPICFSIKKPKDPESLEIKSAFPGEESEREDEENGREYEKDVEKEDETSEKSPVASQQEETFSSPKEPTTPLTKPADMSLEKWGNFCFYSYLHFISEIQLDNWINWINNAVTYRKPKSKTSWVLKSKTFFSLRFGINWLWYIILV